MKKNTQLLIGGNESGQINMNAAMANRHGLIAGATGTGKTVTLQILAEGFSKLGVPVFMADVKGDLSGLSRPGKPHAKIDERVATIKIEDYQARQYPTVFWIYSATLGIHFVRQFQNWDHCYCPRCWN